MKLLPLATAAFLAISTPTSSAQQPTCGPAPQVIEHLESNFQERVAATGVAGGKLVQWFAAKSGTWTMLVIDGHGTACIAAAGDGWQLTSPDPMAGFHPIQMAHPPIGELDPYAGYTRNDKNISCCNDRDCSPAPYNDELGLIQLPSSEWVDPRTHVNRDRTTPAIYFSFDGRGHACVAGGKLVCAFIPGEGV